MKAKDSYTVLWKSKDNSRGRGGGVLGPYSETEVQLHHDSEVIKCIKGFGEVEVEGKSKKIEKGEEVFIEPFKWHKIKNKGQENFEYTTSWSNKSLYSTSEIINSSIKQKRPIIYTATPATPNGALHLGHISGPYLKADMLKRLTIESGGDAYFVTGSDEYQSYVELKSKQENIPSNEIITEHSKRIQTILNGFGIFPDAWYEPSTHKNYHQYLNNFFLPLFEKGFIDLVEMDTLECSKCEQSISCGHVKGLCIHCGEESDGNTCESCALPSLTHELINPYCKKCGEKATKVRDVVPVFKIEKVRAELENYWQQTHLPPRLIELISRVKTMGYGPIEIGFRQEWGVSIDHIVQPGFKYYAWAEMAYGYELLYKKITRNTGLNLSEMDIVQCFGFDNGFFQAVLFPAIYLALGKKELLPKGYVCNEFYLLEGKKFSTSRRHAIWGDDFMKTESAELARFHFALTGPEKEATNFTKESFENETSHFFKEKFFKWIDLLEQKTILLADGKIPEAGLWQNYDHQFAGQISILLTKFSLMQDWKNSDFNSYAKEVKRFVELCYEYLKTNLHLLTFSNNTNAMTILSLNWAALNSLKQIILPIMPRLSKSINDSLLPPPKVELGRGFQFSLSGQNVRGLARRLSIILGLSFEKKVNQDSKTWTKEFNFGLTRPEQMVKQGLIKKELASKLAPVKEAFDFRVPKAFFKGMDAGDHTLSNQVVPSLEELDIKEEEMTDPIGDENFTPVEGITHRYPDRVLFKPTYNCAVYCRFCFRKYKVSDSEANPSEETLKKALEYIAKNKKIKEVIFTGGDPLALGDSKLESLLAPISKMNHIELIRFHTRIPTVLPSRVNDKLIKVLKETKKTIWIVAHINAASELTPEAEVAISKFVDAGIPLISQSVLLKGVNATHEGLMKLVQGLIKNRIKPYYLHYPDLAKGTVHFRIPLQTAIDLVAGLRGKVSGYAIPSLIVDIPGGNGKVSLEKNWATYLGDDNWSFESPLTRKKIHVKYPTIKKGKKYA